jgi:hypothetical protein
MPKNPESGPVTPPDTPTEGPDSGGASAAERRGPGRSTADARPGGNGGQRSRSQWQCRLPRPRPH